MQRRHKVAVASKVAIYARSAQADQDAIDAQVKICEKYAAKENMEIDPSHVYMDNGVSGNTLDQRPALRAMLAAASTQPRPFDAVLVDTKSRLARSIMVLLSVVKQLTVAGVALIFVSERLDSRDPNFREFIVMFAGFGDAYLSRLGDKVRRGQEGKVRSGMIPGEHCYGFRNVAVDRADHEGGPRTIGIKREIVPAEADVIQRIFNLYNSGVTLKEIASQLNYSDVPSPTARLGAPESLWNPTRILGILRNAIYRGLIIWGRTSRVRNPVTGKIETVKKPSNEWVTRDAPEQRIATDEQFHRAQKIQRNRKRGRA